MSTQKDGKGDSTTYPDGRVGPSQSVKDALADAETLRRFGIAEQWCPLTPDDIIDVHSENAIFHMLEEFPRAEDAFVAAMLAARAAFRAVPGLR